METLVRDEAHTTLHRESFGEAGLSFATICGAVGGAVGSAALGAETGSGIMVVWGTLGTMLGSGLAGGAWCMFERVWAAKKSRGPAANSTADCERKSSTAVARSAYS